jgi:HAD superfamily hydrolase (TIGR01509 family)
MIAVDSTDQFQRSKMIKAILFDVNGTLRVREAHETTQKSARQRILEILGKKTVEDAFWDQLEENYKLYGAWAGQHLVQLSEAEIWTNWMLPDEPKEKVAPEAANLMLAWSERKGRVVPKPETEPVLRELMARGYTLGLISNTMSTLDIPGFIERNGWQKYFRVVLLSAFEKSRKPSPDLYLKAASLLVVDPDECVYVGNRYSKDIIGCKKAGFTLGIMLIDSGKSPSEILDENGRPDLVIDSLYQLLDHFPVMLKDYPHIN